MQTSLDWHSHIEATWKFLEGNYRPNTNCPLLYMFVGVSYRSYGIDQLVRFIQAAVHFEPAIWAMAAAPKFNAKRNFIGNPEMASAVSRYASGETGPAAAITAIEKGCRRQKPDGDQLRWLCKTFTPANERTGYSESLGDYLWNLSTSFSGGADDGLYVTLALPAPLATGGGGEHTGRTNWPRFTMGFIRSAISCVSASQLKQYPSDALGLRRFMAGNRQCVFGPSTASILDYVDVRTGVPVNAGKF